MNHTRPSHFRRALVMLAIILSILVITAFVSAPNASTGDPQFKVRLLVDPEVEFERTSAARIEGEPFDIQIVIDSAPTQTVSVRFRTVQDEAEPPEDYQSVDERLEWLAGDSSPKWVQVTTFNRNGYQGDRDFSVTLSAPLGVTIGTQDEMILTILDDEPPPQETATPVYVDRFEPNNTIQQAYPTAAGATNCSGTPSGDTINITLWPVGDIDYFSFAGKSGSAYEILTGALGSNLDTVLTAYNTQGGELASNDDYTLGSRASKVVISAFVDGFYYAKIVNKSPADAANQTYCLEINEIKGTDTPTPSPTHTPIPPNATATRVPGADGCEYNGDFDASCLIGAGESYNLNFVPVWGEGPDNDYFRIWVKPGLMYTCETFDLSSVNDTNMILYDHNRNGIGGNDDKAPGDFGSKVGFYSNYTGWLYVLVGPVVPIEYAISYLYTYSLSCTELLVTPTPPATATRPPYTGGVVPRPPTATPFVVATPSPTPFTAVEVTAIPPQPTATPNIQIVPLPTQTPSVVVQPSISVEYTVYFDANVNYTAELTEGVEDVAVAVYDNATNELLAFGYTNEAGVVRFGTLTSSGQVRISIPFLQYSQTAASDSKTFIRIAPYTQ